MPHALIIDPDNSYKYDLVDCVQRRGFTSDIADSFEQADSLFKQQEASLIIIDAKLKDGTAFDLLNQLRPNSPPYVTILSDDPNLASAIEKLEPKYIICLSKPLENVHIQPIINRVARQIGYKAFRNEKSVKRSATKLILGNSQPIQEIHEMIGKVAPTDATVLICGETGTGKELVARAIHEQSYLKDKPFEAINCGAIPENLVESELFGHEKGAFTGAEKLRRGVFERANGGTIFLDEITEMKPDMQVRLLRVLEEGVLNRVGSENELKISVRVIAATNRDADEAVEDGDFRDDLLFRIAVFPLNLPLLKNRGDDVFMIAEHVLQELNTKHESNKHLTDTAKARLKQYHWPGNVRQLKNIILRSFIVESDELDLNCLLRLIKPSHETGSKNLSENADCKFDSGIQNKQPDFEKAKVDIPVGTTIDHAEQELIQSTIEKCGGDKQKAADILGISLRTIYNRLNKYRDMIEPDDAPL